MADFKFTWNDQIPKETENIIKDAIAKNALDLQGESAKEAPKKFGDLESNCNITDWKNEGGSRFISVGYDLPYARRQHEHPEFRHPLKGKAKFLEDPYKRNEKRYFAYVIKKLKDYLGK